MAACSCCTRHTSAATTSWRHRTFAPVVTVAPAVVPLAAAPAAPDVWVDPELRPLPFRPKDGPQTPMQVLATHEAYRKRSSATQPHKVFEEAQMRMHTFATLMVHVCAGPEAEAAVRPTAALTNYASAPDGPPLALLIASHVRDRTRLKRLRSCLKCVAAQRGGALATVWLSWSADAEVRDAVRTMIADANVPRLHAVEQPDALRQFEHYAALTRYALEELGEGGWTTFSDDDDLLHPDRSSAYLAAIRRAPAGARALGAGWMARPLAAETPSSTAEVDRLVAQGRVVRMPEVDARGARTSSASSWDEYFNYAVQLSSLRTFFEVACPVAVRRSVYADMTLHTFLRNAVPTARFEPAAHGAFAANWGYFYDKPLDLTQAAQQGNASSGASLREQDERATAELRTVAGLEHESDERLLHLAAQERSLAELFCTCFAGAPQPIPIKPFLFLGQIVLLDHLEGLGYAGKVAENLVGKRMLSKLAHTALAFNVPTEPRITSGKG